MPIAQPIMEHIKDKEIDEIVSGIIQLTETLGQLHDKGISHRDIKPAKIFVKRFWFGGFSREF